MSHNCRKVHHVGKPGEVLGGWVSRRKGCGRCCNEMFRHRAIPSRQRRGNDSSRRGGLIKKKGGRVCWAGLSGLLVLDVYLSLMAAFLSGIDAHVRKRKGKYPETKYKYEGLTGLSSTIHPAGERRQRPVRCSQGWSDQRGMPPKRPSSPACKSSRCPPPMH